MEGRNHTIVREFILVGFMDHPELQIPLFVLFLCMYIVTLIGNLVLIILICTDVKLHTPMYFFLSNLSLIDIAYSSVVAPKLLIILISENKSISFMECATQFYFFCILGTSECCLLGIMAYDRFVAIHNPLLYSTAMSKRLCITLVTVSYITSFVNATIQTISVFTLSFCGSNVINHFFCEIPPILKLSCSDTHNTVAIHFTLAMIVTLVTLLFILISYVYIITTILKIQTAEGRHKAISTCVSHLTAVTIFYATLIFVCLRPTDYLTDQDHVISLFYTLVIPMLNPLIYSLRNKEVKEALKRLIV